MRTINLGIGFLLLGALACGKVGEEPSSDAAPNPVGGAISPDHGPLAGGTTVTLTGAGFQAGEAGDVRVVVGGVEVPDVTVVSDTEITFDVPPGPREGAVVDITAFNQSGFTTLPKAYRYNIVPVITAISPTNGPIGGGTTVTITGHGFQIDEAGTPTVLIGSAPLTDVQVVDDETITGTTTAITAAGFSKQDVSFSNANGEDELDEVYLVTKQGLLAYEYFGTRVFWIDTSDGTLAEMPRLIGNFARGCAEGPDGEIYCTDLYNLLKFDPLRGLMTVIGQTLDASSNNIAIRSLATAGTTLYGASPCCRSVGANQLYSIDPATGTVTAVSGAITMSRPTNIASRDGTSLFMADGSTGVLRILSTTGVITNGPTITGDGNQMFAMASIAGTPYYFEKFGSRVFTINPASGEVTLLATLPFTAHAMSKTPASF